ncbi:MAG: c-type cytochrome domain-containing protein, partial [Verrucomicrobiota bacterium]
MRNLLAISLLLFVSPATGHGTTFEKDVFPVFKDFCIGCHNSTDAEAGLNLESYETLIEGSENGPVLTAGVAADSLLWQTVARVAKPKMPPKKEPQPSAAFAATLAKWINGGARGPDSPVSWVFEVPSIAPAPRRRRIVR